MSFKCIIIWLELISKYESLSSEKIASSINIALALQDVHEPLTNDLSLSVNEKSTWSDIHTSSHQLLQQQHALRLKGDLSVRHLGQGNEDSVNQVGKRGKDKSKKSKGQSKGKGSSQNQNQNKGKGKSKDNQRKDKIKRRRPMDHLVRQSVLVMESRSRWKRQR